MVDWLMQRGRGGGEERAAQAREQGEKNRRLNHHRTNRGLLSFQFQELSRSLPQGSPCNRWDILSHAVKRTYDGLQFRCYRRYRER